MDILESTDKDGNIITSEHIRMRGIPTPCITYYAKQNNITALDVYKKLYNNEEIIFDLTNDGNKFVCRTIREYTVSNVSEITRTAKFIQK